MSRLLRLPEVLHRVGLSRSRLYALIQTGEFPNGVKLSERATAWPEADIDAWIERRISESRKGAGAK